MAERFGGWTVEWDRHGFSVRAWGSSTAVSFQFRTLLLPVRILIRETPSAPSGLVLRLLPLRQTEILTGAPLVELERFKKRVSAEVLAAVRSTRGGCSDCAREAGILSSRWEETACPGCHESYCPNENCLRRLHVVSRDGSRVCKHCGAEILFRQKPAHRFVPESGDKTDPSMFQWTHVPPSGDGTDRHPGARGGNAVRPRVRPRGPARQ